MNKFITNNKLFPFDAEIYHGTVVTQILAGNIVHYVFLDKNTHVFAITFDLYKYKTKNFRQQSLIFGDNILFTADFNNKLVIDYEKTIKITKTDIFEDLNLFKTIAVLSPINQNKIWTKTFGIINVDLNNKFYLQAYPNVAIDCWISITIDVQNYKLVPIFYDFIQVTQNDRFIVWNTDWNIHKNRKIDFSSDEEDFIEKNKEEILGVKTCLEGIVINENEIFCPFLNDEKVFVGLWEKRHIENNSLNGYKLSFDAFYSDICNAYIIYYYEIISSSNLYDVIKDKRIFNNNSETSNYCFTNSLIKINIQLSDYIFGRFLYHLYFGLIANNSNLLLGLPNFNCNIKYISAYVTDRGPYYLDRFKIVGITEETRELVNYANTYLTKIDIEDTGFVVDQSIGLVYCYKYPYAKFYIPNESLHIYNTGVWIKFKASYNLNCNFFKIFLHSFNFDMLPIDCSLITESNTTQPKYEFKIEVNYYKTNRTILFNKFYGFIIDYDKKFLPKCNLQKYDIIVELDDSIESTNLFKFKRIAEPNQRLSTTNIVRIGKIIDLFEDNNNNFKTSQSTNYSYNNNILNNNYNNKNEKDVLFELLGLSSLPKLFDSKINIKLNNENRKISNVEYNSNRSIQKRKTEAYKKRFKKTKAIYL